MALAGLAWLELSSTGSEMPGGGVARVAAPRAAHSLAALTGLRTDSAAL